MANIRQEVPRRRFVDYEGINSWIRMSQQDMDEEWKKLAEEMENCFDEVQGRRGLVARRWKRRDARMEIQTTEQQEARMQGEHCWQLPAA